MEIKNPNNVDYKIKPSIGKLNSGDVFLYDGAFYLKTLESTILNTTTVIRLTNGEVYHWSNDTIITPINGFFSITN